MIFQKRSIRITLLLNALLLIIIITLVVIGHSYNKKINENENQIQDIKIQLDSLQKAASRVETETSDESIADRALAPYEEIVPFIGFLESLFGIIDKDSKITIRNEEKQIRINRYADYEISLKPGKKIELFLKALDGLYKSHYLTKIINFRINYTPAEAGASNSVDNISLVIRLYFE